MRRTASTPPWCQRQTTRRPTRPTTLAPPPSLPGCVARPLLLHCPYTMLPPCVRPFHTPLRDRPLGSRLHFASIRPSLPITTCLCHLFPRDTHIHAHVPHTHRRQIVVTWLLDQVIRALHQVGKNEAPETMQAIAPDYDHVGTTLTALRSTHDNAPPAIAVSSADQRSPSVGSEGDVLPSHRTRARQRAHSNHTELEILETRYAESAGDDLFALQQESSAECVALGRLPFWPHTPARSELRPHTVACSELRPHTVARFSLRSHTPARSELRPHTVARSILRPLTPARSELRPHTHTLPHSELRPHTRTSSFCFAATHASHSVFFSLCSSSGTSATAWPRRTVEPRRPCF